MLGKIQNGMICLNRVTHTNALLSILGSSGPKKRPDTHKVDISTKKLKELNQIRYEGFIWILLTRVPYEPSTTKFGQEIA